MPPKVKITREMIQDAAFELARKDGAEVVNARSISKLLGCSTQPVLYHFKSMEEIRKAVYMKADQFHSEYIMAVAGEEPMMEIGLNYIRFANREKNLFRLLFQSGEFSGANLSVLMDEPELAPILKVLGRETGLSENQAKKAFRSLFLFAHGYASMLANNDMEYDEEVIKGDMCTIFEGAIYALKGENENG